jgi:hypothetical protein
LVAAPPDRPGIFNFCAVVRMKDREGLSALWDGMNGKLSVGMDMKKRRRRADQSTRAPRMIEVGIDSHTLPGGASEGTHFLTI